MIVIHNGHRWEVADNVNGWVLLTNNLDRSEWVELAVDQQKEQES